MKINIPKPFDEIPISDESHKVAGDDVYSVKELADKIKVSELTIRRWIKDNPQIRTMKFGNLVRINKPDFDNWFKERWS